MNINRRNFVKLLSGITAGITLFPYQKLRASTEDKVIRSANSAPQPALWKDTEINIAWIGHSTILMNLYGTIILTDAVLSDQIGIRFLGITIGPGRITAPALTIEQIPKPDIMLLSHAHMDHMDYETLKQISGKYKNEIDCITAYNTSDVISDLPWKSLVEIDWGEKYEVHDTSFRAVQVKHFGWRFPWEKDRSRGYMKDGRSYNAYLISKQNKKILFGGDTAYSELFRSLKDENIDVAIMPVGAYNPWRSNHCTPEEALIMSSQHMNVKYFIPVHCKTFKVSSEPLDEPLEWLNRSVKNYEIELGLKDIGETFTMEA